MQRIFYLVQKELLLIFRDKTNLAILFILPFIQLVLLGFAITTDVKNLSVTIVDYDHSPASRQISALFQHSAVFRDRGASTSEKTALAKLDAHQVVLAVVIPRNLQKDLARGQTPTLQLLIDSVDGNSAALANGYAAGTLQAWAQSKIALPSSAKLALNTTLEEQMIYNPDLASRKNIVPGIIGVLITMITLFLSALNIVREKELGTLEQLNVTPISKNELMLGKIIPFALLGFVMLNVGLLAAGFIFGLWPQGSILLLYAMSFLLMLATLALGLFVSIIARTQQQAIFFAWFLAIFIMLLSGFFIPIENMPPAIQILTLINPLRYYMVIMRAIFLKGATLADLWSQASALLLFGVTMLFLAITSFRKRIS